MVTYGEQKTPVELVIGRKPRDVATIEELISRTTNPSDHTHRLHGANASEYGNDVLS